MAPELAFFPCGSFWIRRPERPSWEIHKIQYNLLLQEVFYLSFSDQKVFNYASQKKSFSGNEPSGMPPHYLRLKIGSSIMLLRNLDAPRLCNGTRLCVKTVMPHVIEATIRTGRAKGEDVFIPRIPSSLLICHFHLSDFSFQYVLPSRCPSISPKDNHLKLLASV
jgi:hypothetical protein